MAEDAYVTRDELRAEMAEFHKDWAEFRAEMHREWAEFRVEIRTEIANMRADMGRMEARLTKWVIAGGGIGGIVGGLIGALARLSS